MICLEVLCNPYLQELQTLSKTKTYIRSIGGFSLNDIFLMGYFGKNTLNKDKIEPAKEPLFACIYELRSDCISERRSSFDRYILDERYVMLWRLTDL